jgi:hypothetical protein
VTAVPPPPAGPATAPPTPPAAPKPPWWQAIAVDVSKSAALVLALDTTAAAVFKSMKLPAADLLYVTAIGVGATALISALANLTHPLAAIRRKP